MNRYLLNISYIGTNFRGVQKVLNSDRKFDTSTVQGCLDLALEVFRPVNPIQTHLSSRTDAGVHALHSSVHVDLERQNGMPYIEDVVTGVLNRTLDKQKLPIRILSTIRVPDTFHCRFNAKARTYLYRIAVAKDGPPGDVLKNRNYQSFVPVEELKRCFFLQDHRFDIELFKEAANLFKGRHDFRTFMNTNDAADEKPMFTIRLISDIKVYPGKSIAVHFDANQAEDLYDYWNIEVTGRSFLYKQVRRIIGTLIAVAYNRITLKDVYEMITIPSKLSWNSRVQIAPPFGLYLCKVHYNTADFIHNKSDNELESFNHESTTTAPVEKRQAEAN